MRILSVQNATYVPAHGGANKATRTVVRGLAAAGHTCRAVARASAATHGDAAAHVARELAARAIPVVRTTSEAVVFDDHGVEVHAVMHPMKMRGYVTSQLTEFAPDWTLAASEDPGQRLLEPCLPHAVYFAQTTLLLPFGPAAALPLARAGDLIRRAAGVIVVSQYLRDYFRRWAGIEATVIRPPVFGLGPFPRFGSSSRGFVTIVNPSAVKGIDIFLMLVAAFPEVEFAAVVGWGTTQRDRAALESLPNVQLLPAADDLADVFRRSRVLVMPSLWAEAFGCVAIEAMLHGIPVLASDVGGLPEAKLGVDYVLPVRPIERYTSQLDDQMMPMPIVPPQDGAPWIDALRELLTDAATYERVAERSRSAATQAVADIGARPFVDYFEALDAAREGE